jgi:hypothetical protein
MSWEDEQERGGRISHSSDANEQLCSSRSRNRTERVALISLKCN